MSDPKKSVTAGVVVATGVAIAAAVFVGSGGSDGADPEEEATRTPIEVASLGPQVGERVPDFRLPDQNGRVHTLESILGPNGAMLLFHRSADW